MRFCFELVTAGPRSRAPRLEIDEPRGRAHCRTCGATSSCADLVLLCPCGSADVALLSGRELAVTSVEVV